MAVLDDVLKIRDDPVFANNKRGQIKRMLQLVDEHTHNELSIAFSLHTLPICTRVSEELGLDISALNDFPLVIGEVEKNGLVINNIEDLRIKLNNIYFKLMECGYIRCRAAQAALYSLEVAIHVCFQDELIVGKFIVPRPRRRRTTAQPVSYSSLFAVAYEQGGEDWDSTNKDLRNAARQRGEDASKQEAEWQINYLISLLTTRNM